MSELLKRFRRYVRFDTRAVDETEDYPSSPGQLELGRRLVEELGELGLRGIGEERPSMDENGYVLAELPGTAEGCLGLLAHLDTAPAFTGKVKGNTRAPKRSRISSKTLSKFTSSRSSAFTTKTLGIPNSFAYSQTFSVPTSTP